MGSAAQRAADAVGVSLGPIGLTIGSDLSSTEPSSESDSEEPGARPESISALDTAVWRERYEKDGRVDLWIEEEFNSGSRLVVSWVWFGGWGKGLASHHTLTRPVRPPPLPPCRAGERCTLAASRAGCQARAPA